MKINVFKKFNDFIKYNESHNINKLEHYQGSSLNWFGFKPGELDSNFYFLNNYKYKLISIESTFVDDNSRVRKEIKIGETLKPCIFIKIYTNHSSLGNSELLSDIKSVIKKIKSICKFKSKIDFNKLFIIDPEVDDNIVLNEDSIKSDDPFNLVSIEGKEFIYDINNDSIMDDNLMICMVSDSEYLINGQDFYHYYDLSGSLHIDKEKNIWTRFDLRDVAISLFDDYNFINKHYQQTDDLYYRYNDLDTSDILRDVVENISLDDKDKLIDIILEYMTIEEINTILSTSYRSLYEISNDKLIELLESSELDSNTSIVSSITTVYDSILNDKYNEKVEEFIVNSIYEYMDDMDITYIKEEIRYSDSEIDRYIHILFDPNIFVNDYLESGDDVEDWNYWSSRLGGSDIDIIIDKYLSDKHGGNIYSDSFEYIPSIDNYNNIIEDMIDIL